MYIVIGGGGKVGEALARRLLASGNEVAIIEESPDRATRLANSLSGRLMVVCGNCCDSVYLSESGIGHADIFCTVTGQDDDNLAACEVARALFKVPRCISRVNNPRNERIFNSLGIQAISSTAVIAQIIAERATSTQTRTAVTLRHGEYTIMEVVIPDSSELKAEGGLHAFDIDLPSSAIIVAVLHGEQFESVDSQTVLHAGDAVLLLVRSEEADAARIALIDL